MSWDGFGGLGHIDSIRVTGVVDKPKTRPETDDELRARLLYVGGDGPAAAHRIGMARGAELDVLADSMSLKRRAVPV